MTRSDRTNSQALLPGSCSSRRSLPRAVRPAEAGPRSIVPTGIAVAAAAMLWSAASAESISALAADAKPAYEQVNAGVHFDSKVSGGPLPILDLVNKAKRYGLDVAIITDRDQADIEYGLPGLRNIAKYTHIEPSIRTLGADRYLDQIRDAQMRVPGVLTIPGAECMPFYFWEEDFSLRAMKSLKPGRMLRLRNAHVHLMAIGLERASDYERLPSIATGYPVVLSLSSLTVILYLALIWFGFRLVVRRGSLSAYYAGPRSRRNRRMRRTAGGLMVTLGALMLVNAAIGPPRMYDQYQQDQDVAPIQRFIDYVHEQGGMVFWAHPEVEQNLSLYGIQAYTPAYHTYMLRTRGYTGFAIFWEGMRYAGPPGGTWDMVLTEYCTGERSEPVWALGELDYESDWGPDAIRETLTVLLMKKRSDRVLAVLRKGMAAAPGTLTPGAGTEPVAATMRALAGGGIDRDLQEGVENALRQGRLTECAEANVLAALQSGGYPDYTKLDVLKALRGGKMYAARNFTAFQFRIDDFLIASADGLRVAYSGDRIQVKAPAKGLLRVRALKDMDNLSFALIRDRAVVEVFRLPKIKRGQTATFPFDVPVPQRRPNASTRQDVTSFYRLLGYRGPDAVMATNPIFVTGPEPRDAT